MLNTLKHNMNRTTTENGGVAHTSTMSSLLDFFALGGALRGRDEAEIVRLFNKAFVEDSLLAMKMLFYFRDIRGGQGERRVFRVVLQDLADKYTDVVLKNLHLISKYGRWDDYYCLCGTKAETAMFEHLRKQFQKDCDAKHPSLLAKWLKSENASSQETRRLARKTIEAFELTPMDYRVTLTNLRRKIGIIETKMSEKQWDSINYETVPSRAAMIYREAFKRNDPVRYEEYLNAVSSGEKKINANTLYPYDLVSKYLSRNFRFGSETDDTVEAQWKALPNYVETEENSMVVADVSGSMYWGVQKPAPIEVSVSLAIYLAEKNKGLFHNHFITFSEEPRIQELKGNNLCEKCNNLRKADWGYNTNIQKVFMSVLNTAVKNKIPQEEMIKKLYVVSDMEFDEADGRQFNETVFESIRRQYQEAGYELPQLVFWNVASRHDQFPMTMNDMGVQFVSGASPSIFKNLMKGEFKSAYDLMIEVITSERYSPVVV